jgi:hypothetical protein
MVWYTLINLSIKKKDKSMENTKQKEAKVNSKRFTNICPECNSTAIQHEGSCYVCHSCGYSPCK